MQKISEKISKKIQKIAGNASVGLILGSGFGGVVEQIENKIIIPYTNFKDLPKCTVAGHSGNFVVGTLNGIKVVAMQGRFHLYEGNSSAQVTLPIRVMKNLQINKLIITNAAGGINQNFSVGDIMLITDHINLTGQNALIGLKATEQKPIFIDMLSCYNKGLVKNAKLQLEKIGIQAKTGIYLQVNGPSYETPAEIKAFAALGADAVGMSTAIEAIFARYLGIDVLAMSCITNMAAGITQDALDHKDVLAVSKSRTKTLTQALQAVIK